MQLGNLYFDAERFDDAVKWYEEALTIDPQNVNASTDLGIAYYYTNQPDRALAQFDRSLAIDPKHSKTLLNIGIVRAFGKQDLDGAGQGVAAGPRRCAGLAEAGPRKQALDGLRSAHPDVPGGDREAAGLPGLTDAADPSVRPPAAHRPRRADAGARHDRRGRTATAA